jgi:hypothetical protein
VTPEGALTGYQRVTAAWTLAVDALTAEVVGALAESGVHSVLLKGPSIAGWLYEGEIARPYADTDLLVSPTLVTRAAAVLGSLGFRREWGTLDHAGMQAPPSYPWTRRGLTVDLHEVLPGAGGPPQEVWGLLSRTTQALRVGGREVAVLGLSERLVHLALHAAHHGPDVERPLEDLRRALRAMPARDWAEAARTAESLGAGGAFVDGLSMLPEGRGRLRELGMEARRSVPSLLKEEEAPLAHGFERLAGTPGLSGKASLLRGELMPSAEFMRWWSPLARRSWRGLVAAYAWRILWLGRHAPASLTAWRRARRIAGW